MSMIPHDTCLAILDTINQPIAFVDNDHVIRYLNKSAMKLYYEARGYSDLIGQSIFACHNEQSQTQIIEHHKRLKAGENEIVRIAADKGKKFTTVAVRDGDGKLMGYYERFEKIGVAGENTSE